MSAPHIQPALPLSVLIVGGGMYVAGRGAPGYRGTLAPALLEGVRAGKIGRLGIATTRMETALETRAAVLALAADMGVTVDVAAFADFRAAAASFKPHAAVVSVPDAMHAPCTVPLAEAGIHCLVVKPMADTLEAAREMAAAARRGGVVGQVEFHKRLDESNLVLKDSLAAGQIGKPLYAIIEYSQKKTIPRDVFRGWAASTNILQYLGVHYVDLLQWATGFTPVKVSAWGQKDYLAAEGVDTWDAIQAVVEWRRPDGGSFVSTHITNWVDPDSTTAMSDQKINVVGTAGRFQADQKHRGIQLVTDQAGPRDLNPYFTQSYRDPLSGHLRFDGYGIKSVLQFVDDVLAFCAGAVTVDVLDAVRPSFAQCVVSTAVVEAAGLSLAQGGIPMEIPV